MRVSYYLLSFGIFEFCKLLLIFLKRYCLFLVIFMQAICLVLVIFSCVIFLMCEQVNIFMQKYNINTMKWKPIRRPDARSSILLFCEPKATNI